MNRLLVFALLLVIALPLAAQDVEFLQETTLEFGTVEQGEVLEGTIEFINRSDRDVTLLEVKASCGCTAVKPDKMTFEPGEKGVIPYSVKTENFSGVIRKSIRVAFKDADPANSAFVVTADVKAPLQLAPRYLSLQNIPVNPDTVITEFVEIENNTAGDVAITEVVTTLPNLTVSPATVTIPARKSHLMKVEFTPSEAGRVNTEIVVKTDHPRVSTLNLRVFIYVSGNQAAVTNSGS